MEVLAPDEVAAPPGAAVTIGAYDGVHRGHRALLAMLRARADALGAPTAVVTFDHHPATIVRPESAPLLLTDLDQKLELLASCGVNLTVVVPFDRRRADESAEDFVQELLVAALGARLVVVGEDFHFGHGRKGDVTLLAELGRIHGFDVDGVRLTETGGDPVSSTRIRGLLAEGEVTAAAALLGRPYRLRGTVVVGDRRGGSELGFPTANLAHPDDMVVPGVGIYAGRYRRAGGEEHTAAISVGRRPTFYTEPQPPLVEAHLLDFGVDIYGEQGEVAFVEKLRDEERFDRVEDLVAQMHRDVARTRELLG
ncbi:MAG: bifunctional riboflavin kinase/FAD synthetase [Acidimicrobiales bacterium]